MSAKRRFALGQTVATPDALEALLAANQAPGEFLRRHQSGDWGDMPEEDKVSNDESVKQGGGAMSAYTLSTGVKIWVITESDRSVTTLLLPSEY